MPTERLIFWAGILKTGNLFWGLVCGLLLMPFNQNYWIANPGSLNKHMISNASSFSSLSVKPKPWLKACNYQVSYLFKSKVH
jgi:hypothetical protein